jgi:hypothetical protein
MVVKKCTLIFKYLILYKLKTITILTSKTKRCHKMLLYYGDLWTEMTDFWKFQWEGKTNASKLFVSTEIQQHGLCNI